MVATEVRNLAQRSAEAAKEIKGLINDSVERIREGSELVDQSGDTLSKIVESVKTVNGIVADIAAASEEQATGIDMVNRAVTEMDGSVQHNVSIVQQAAKASATMEGEAQSLLELVRFFQVDGVDPVPPAGTLVTRAADAEPAPVGAPAQEPASSGDNSEWEDF